MLEVGLGGRLDATNVVRPAVCAITSLSYDHVELLGHTLSLIAWEKAGIIKAGVPVVSAPQEPEAMAVIQQVCGDTGARLVTVGEDWTVSGWFPRPDRADADGAAPGGRVGAGEPAHPVAGAASDHQCDGGRSDAGRIARSGGRNSEEGALRRGLADGALARSLRAAEHCAGAGRG